MTAHFRKQEKEMCVGRANSISTATVSAVDAHTVLVEVNQRVGMKTQSQSQLVGITISAAT